MHLSNVLDKLDELGEILDEMLRMQDDVEVIHFFSVPSSSSINSSFADPSRRTTEQSSRTSYHAHSLA